MDLKQGRFLHSFFHLASVFPFSHFCISLAKNCVFKFSHLFLHKFLMLPLHPINVMQLEMRKVGSTGRENTAALFSLYSSQRRSSTRMAEIVSFPPKSFLKLDWNVHLFHLATFEADLLPHSQTPSPKMEHWQGILQNGESTQ